MFREIPKRDLSPPLRLPRLERRERVVAAFTGAATGYEFLKIELPTRIAASNPKTHHNH
jgi:hypothetical protein